MTVLLRLDMHYLARSTIACITSCMRKYHIVSLIALAACAGATDDTTINESPSSELPASLQESAATTGDGSPLATDAVESSPEYGETFEGEYVPHTYDEIVSRFAQAFKAELTDTEAASVEDGLRQTPEADRLRVQGRVLVDDDAFLNVDTLLGDVVRSVDKGRTLSGTLPHPVTSIQSSVYARMDPANPADFQFKRPYFGYNRIKVIVPNSTVAGIVQLAVDKLKAAADDCITNSSIDVILADDWDDMGSQQQFYAPIHVAYGAQATVCPTSTVTVSGCAAFPRAYSIAIGTNLFQVRMVVGSYVGLNSTYVNGTDDESVGSTLHELLHTFGFGHTSGTDDANYLTIPGTSGKLAATSIMRGRSASNYSNDLSSDDIASIDTLYSAQPGSVCSTLLYETTCAQACVKISNVNVAGQCCWCSGSLNHYVKSSWSGTTYICQ